MGQNGLGSYVHVSTSTPPTLQATDWSPGGMGDQSCTCMNVLKLISLINCFCVRHLIEVHMVNNEPKKIWLTILVILSRFFFLSTRYLWNPNLISSKDMKLVLFRYQISICSFLVGTFHAAGIQIPTSNCSFAGKFVFMVMRANSKVQEGKILPEYKQRISET